MALWFSVLTSNVMFFMSSLEICFMNCFSSADPIFCLLYGFETESMSILAVFVYVFNPMMNPIILCAFSATMKPCGYVS